MSTQTDDPWARNQFVEGGGAALLSYVVFGAFAERIAWDPKKYGARGVLAPSLKKSSPTPLNALVGLGCGGVPSVSRAVSSLGTARRIRMVDQRRAARIRSDVLIS